MAWIASGSRRIAPTRIRGSSDAYGSWNTSCRSLRSLRTCLDERAAQVVAVEDDAPGGRLLQRHHHPADRRLAAAGLSDQAERLSDPDLDADVRDRLDRARLALQHSGGDRELLAHAGQLQQRKEPALPVRRGCVPRGDDPLQTPPAPGGKSCRPDPLGPPAARLGSVTAAAASVPPSSSIASTSSALVCVGKKHANWCAGSGPPSCGSSSRQAGCAYRHRGANRQPVNGPVSSGGRPGIEYSRCRASWSIFGIEASSASV